MSNTVDDILGDTVPTPTGNTNSVDSILNPTTTTPEAYQPSTAEAVGRGFANSASLGLGKWVNGVREAIQYPSYGQNPLTEGAGQFWADVTKSVEGQKAANAAAMSAHPVAYTAGAAAPAIIGGIGAATKTAAFGALPTTIPGQIALGAGTGAVSGAAEETTPGKAAAGALIGANVGGVLSAVPAVATSLMTKFGTTGALNAIEKSVNDAKSSNGITSSKAFEKLSELTGSEIPTTDAQRADVLAQAQSVHQVISKSPSIFVNPESVEAAQFSKMRVPQAVRSMAPSGMQMATDVAMTSPVAAGLAYGAHAGLTTPLGMGTAALGALTGAKGTGALMKDVSQWGAMKYAGSPAAQKFMNTASPLAGGSAGSTVGSSGGQMGLSGILGNYIDQTWANR